MKKESSISHIASLGSSGVWNIVVPKWRWFLYYLILLSVIKHTSQNHVEDDIEILDEISIIDSHAYDKYLRWITYKSDDGIRLKSDELTMSTSRNISSDQFPKDLFSYYDRKHGAIIIHIIAVLYLATALHVVCSFYFIPALEIICHCFKIQDDVAGATLMTWGSSLPDICATVIGVLVTNGDVGLGTAMGASIFNVLFVIGLCGVVAPEALVLSWWSLMRDFIWYVLSMMLLVVVIYDKKVYWQEAIIMLILYFLYFIMLWQNKRIEKEVYRLLGDEETYKKRFTERPEFKLMIEVSDGDNDKQLIKPPDVIPSIFEWPTYGYVFKYITYVVLLPIRTLFFLTIPDLRHPSIQKFFPVTFVMSVVWIGLISYIIMWMMTVIGQTLGISSSLMGVTIVCLATSLPDLICSIIVSQYGKIEMAVAQAMGGSTFSILAGLGLSWFIKSYRVKVGRSYVEVNSTGLVITGYVDIAIGLLVMLIFVKRRFVHDRKLGILLITCYVIYFIYLIVSELLIK